MRTYILFFIQFLFHIKTISPSNIFLIPLEKFQQDELDYYAFYLENYSHKISLSFNNAVNYLSNDFFNEKGSNKFLFPEPGEINDFLSEYYLYCDNIQFKNSYIPFMYCFYTNNNKTTNEFTYKDILTLRFPKPVKDQSIIYDLSKQNLIKNKQLGLYFKKNFLIIGGVPQNFKAKKLATIKLNYNEVSQRSWVIKFKTFSMGNKINITFKYTVEYRFDLIGTAIGVPSNVFEEIKEKYFENYLNDAHNTCYIQNISERKSNNKINSGNRIFCKKNIIENIPSISLGLGENGVKITLKKESLWKCENNDYCLFELTEKTRTSVIHLGTLFAYDYLVIFDFENVEIHIYDIVQENIIQGQFYLEKDNLRIKIIFNLTFLAIIFGIITIVLYFMSKS